MNSLVQTLDGSYGIWRHYDLEREPEVLKYGGKLPTVQPSDQLIVLEKRRLRYHFRREGLKMIGPIQVIIHPEWCLSRDGLVAPTLGVKAKAEGL